MTKRVSAILLAIAAVVILSLSSCAVLAGSAFDTVMGAEPESDGSGGGGDGPSPEPEDAPQLRIVTTPSGANVWLNNRHMGRTPLDLDDLDGGTYRLRIEKDGYYDVQRWIEVPSTGSKTVDVTLEMITGFLDVTTQPRGAIVRVDGDVITGGFAEVPIGFHRITVQQFGYQEKTLQTLVHEDSVTRVSVVLEEAPFTVSEISLSRNAFNPANPGATGLTVLSFRVSGAGTGDIHIRDEDGHLVLTESLSRFDTWEQQFQWDGRLDNGQAAPDGLYSIDLDTKGDDGRPFSTTRIVRIDSSLVVRYRSIWSSAPGFLFTPDMAVLPARSFELALATGGVMAWNGTQFVTRFPGILGLRAGVGGGVELALYGGLIVHSDPVLDRWSVGGSATWTAMDQSVAPGLHLRTGVVTGGVFRSPSLQGEYAAPDSSANAPGFHVSIPVEITGTTFGAVVAPQLTLSPAPVYYGDGPRPANEWGFHGYLKAALYGDFRSSTAAISAALRTSRLDEPFAVELPVQVGAEYHWIIPETSLVLSAFAASEIFGSADFYLFGGLGFGLLF